MKDKNGKPFVQNNPVGYNMYKKKYTSAQIIEQANSILDWMLKNPDRLFYKEAFADASFNRIVNYNSFVKKYQQVDVANAIMEEVKCLTEVRLINNTISGGYASPHFSMFLLKNWNGYVDKTEQKVDVNSTETVFNFGNEELNAE